MTSSTTFLLFFFPADKYSSYLSCFIFIIQVLFLLHEDPRHISFLNRYHCALSPNNPLLISGNPHLLLLKLNLKQLSNDISTINRSEGGWKIMALQYQIYQTEYIY